MSSVQKRGKKWVAEIRIQGNYKSKTFETKIEAEFWAAETTILLSRQTGKHITGKTVEMAFERYAREVSPGKRGHRWEAIRLEKLSRSSLAHIQLSQLTTDDLDQWIDENAIKLAPNTVRREFSVITSVLKKARKPWKWIRDDQKPWEDVTLPKKGRSRSRRVSNEEITAIL